MQPIEAFAWISTLSNYQKAGILAAVLIGGSAAIVLLIGGLAGTAIITALGFVGALVLTSNYLPKRCKEFLINHPLFTNVLATFITAMFIGVASVTGMLTTIFAAFSIDIVQRIIGYLRKGKKAFEVDGGIIPLSKSQYAIS